MKKILVISTLDTKGVETFYLRDKIRQLGKTPVVIDISMRQAEGFRADVTPEEVAKAGGSTYEAILASRERAKNTAIMTRGASSVALEMWKRGELDGVIGIGGSTGSLMATDVMRALPFGVPKMMISSTAALPGMSTRYIDIGDIALFHSVVEISGLSEVLKNVIDRAAHAICSMAEVAPLGGVRKEGGRKAIAITMLGPCEKCASRVRQALESKGFDVIGFSAAGIGDRAMEAMVEQGLFSGVIDLAPGAVIEHLVGGMRDAGPTRMETAGRSGIPQVISTCGLNHITPPKSKYTDDHKSRRKYDLDKFRTWLRASPDELKKAAMEFKRKLNNASGPVKIVLPMKGWSSVDVPGSATYDPEEDKIFVNELKNGLKKDIDIIEVDANMEEPGFAEAVVRASISIF
ncbi:MAG TPA: Tm-1-like ATP-binding domain-containing protein [Syntrophorhabdaceae bacterium]|nr:Tm-1-like ATP-binding domain-containing protein [Syntrophorhabdaceae bacterium]HOL05108.1 Tm-1-like ATP-binding domain-containing protein [Syntrophorhabdaceae bacterium]HON84574.1 Tm-1-like ATP-binding domain-containing protein [Syntrophorhabdaceae bacterium]HOT41077.1 Tm-1-like ATP-binding domain-containing protein [Syntrophorhabdaceae bacterium]HPC66220.1 Tm-1-like ATP-binding domain-containing protein [Syntrophorhabdaceae bacterium]